jgi:hypothetical protein
MVDVEVAITIRRPRRDVARVMFDPRYDATWIGGVIEAERGGAGPMLRGSTWQRTCRRLWRRRRTGLCVVDFVPDSALEFRADPPLAERTRYTLEGIPEGTIVRIETQRDADGGVRLPAAIGCMLLRRAVIRDLDRLKWLVEAGSIG